MKNIKKLMGLALFMTMAMTVDIFSMGQRRRQGANKKVTFNNQLQVDATLTGPRGSRAISSKDQESIMPLRSPVQYTIAADGYDTYSGQATAGKTYYICDDNGAIAVQTDSCQ